MSDQEDTKTVATTSTLATTASSSSLLATPNTTTTITTTTPTDIVDHILCQEEREIIGERGEHLESCIPLQYPSDIDVQFVKKVITRCLCASYRAPHLFSSYVLNSPLLIRLLRKAILVFSQEQNIVDVIVPQTGSVHIIGDTHGDLHSLISLLSQTGLPSSDNFLVFSGDYVDRGPWGIEIILIIALLKLWQPKNVFMLRGNHETSACIQRYGFESEVKYKYSAKMIPLFINLFRQLPLIAVVRVLPNDNTSSSNDKKQSQNHLLFSAASFIPHHHQHHQKKKKLNSRSSKRLQHSNQNSASSSSSSLSPYPWACPLKPGERRVIVMHGGLFRSEQARKEKRNDIARLTELMKLNRNDADPYGNAIEDVLWSDPQLSHKGILQNSYRGCGILFGETTVEYFFQNNAVHGIIRAHEGPDMRQRRPDMPDMQKGYSVDMELASGFVATVFSSANYSFQEPKANKGAFATIFGKRHKDAQSTAVLPRFTMFERFNPPPEDEVHLFYTGDGPCCTPRQSFS